MAYTKNTWSDGDYITSTKLNHIEDGLVQVEKGVLAGTATTLSTVATGADAAAVLAKVNEIVGVLNRRGISKA